MTQPMKPSKHVDGSISENCLDRISSLPDDVLGHVLSFLPTRSAGMTSVLSMRWRHLFTLTTSLSFEDERFSVHKDKSERIEAAQKFKEFIEKVLELHQISPINKFSLVCGGVYDNSDLNRWVSHAIQKGVQEFHYELAGFIDSVPDDFFMCETFVSLNFKRKGYGHNRIKIPMSPRLPKLKILHLGNIIFFDFNSMERLFSGCELLEKLTLEYCQCQTDGHATYRTGLLKVLTIRQCSFDRGTFEIDAPNLAHLKYNLNTGVKIVPSWKNLCSAYDDFDTKVDLPKYEHELLTAAASKATQLHFKMHTMEFLFKLNEDEHMPGFPSLSSVQVRIYPYYVREYATSLIGKSPQLEHVIFESCFLDCPSCFDYTSEGSCCECGCQLPSDIPQVPFSCDVQVIEVHKFCGYDSSSRSLMEHLVRNATGLKRLIVHIHSGCDLERVLEISKYLLMLPRASIGCHVEINFGSRNTTLTSIPGQT